MSSLERFSEYRGFGLERFHCISTYVLIFALVVTGGYTLTVNTEQDSQFLTEALNFTCKLRNIA